MDFKSVLKITGVNLRHNFLPHFLLALFITLLTPVLFGTSSLNARDCAQPLEMFLSLNGIVLLTPVFMPEQDKNICDLIRSKKIDYLSVCALRLVYSVICLAVIFGIFTLFMYHSECEVTLRHFAGGLSSAMFLGATGFFFAGVTGNGVIGYMVSIMYYIGNFILKDDLKYWYLFSMSHGSFDGKCCLLVSSVILFLTAFVIIKKFEK